jgi:hypothetical protein
MGRRFPVGAAGDLENNRDMYLIFASIWFIAGIGVLAYQMQSGDQRLSLQLFGTSISCGWVMILLSGYNALRWWVRRPAEPRLPAAQSMSRRQRVRRLEEPRERDPNFVFTDEPPPAPPRHDVPPSQN